MKIFGDNTVACLLVTERIGGLRGCVTINGSACRKSTKRKRPREFSFGCGVTLFERVAALCVDRRVARHSGYLLIMPHAAVGLHRIPMNSEKVRGQGVRASSEHTHGHEKVPCLEIRRSVDIRRGKHAS